MLYTPGLKRRKLPSRVVPRVTFVCPTCGVAFKDLASQRSGARTYCSRRCYGESKKGKPAHNRGKKVIASKPCEHCGELFFGQPAKVAPRRFCSMKCSGAYRSGPRCPAWRGGSQKMRDVLGHTPEYAAWRVAVRTRDRGRCRVCDSEGVRNYKDLETHHIVPVAAAFDLATNVDNGITLCRKHHLATLGRENEQAAFFASLLGVPLVAPAAPNRKDRAPFTMTEQELRTEYLERQRTQGDIAAEWQVTSACVWKYLRRYNIPARSTKEAAGLRKRVPWNLGKRTIVEKKCEHCGKQVGGRWPADVKGRRFCSKKCFGAYTSGDRHYKRRRIA